MYTIRLCELVPQISIHVPLREPRNELVDHATGRGLDIGIVCLSFALQLSGSLAAETTKPIIDSEPVYEDHLVELKKSNFGHTTANDVRRPLLGV